MMRYFLYLVLYLPIQVLTYLVTPLLALCIVSRVGGCNNNQSQCVGQRLWKFLAWFDTPDNSLDGDARFQSLHKPQYLSRVLWLYRNSLYGFKWTVLSLPEGHPDAWQWHKKFYFKNSYLDLNFGWMLDNIENGVAMFHFSPRLRKV